MAKTLNDITFINELDCKNLQSVLCIIQEINNALIAVNSEQELFDVLTKEIAVKLQYANCSAYVVEHHSKTCTKKAEYNTIEIKKSDSFFLMDKFVGKVVEEERAYYINSVDNGGKGDGLVFPLIIEGKLYGIVSGVRKNEMKSSVNQQKIIEIILSIASGIIVRIHKEEQFHQLQGKLELLLNEQRTSLAESVDKVVAQTIKIKSQEKTQEVLLQEIHHRVTNNLQIISSILRLYKNEGEKKDVQILNEVQNKVEAMALIYQNIYKSIEINKVDVRSYMADLSQYLSYSVEGLTIRFLLDIDFDYLHIETLVSVGLFITEIFYKWYSCCREHQTGSLILKLTFRMLDEGERFQLIMKDDLDFDATKKENSESDAGLVNKILISALVDQLDAKMGKGYKNGNFVQLHFNVEK